MIYCNEKKTIDEINTIINKKKYLRMIKKRFDKLNKITYYDYSFHGIKHAFNVSLFALIILHYEHISFDADILIDAALLHDFGRISDYDGYNHGKLGAIFARKIKSDDPYYDEHKLNLLCALIEGHCDNIYNDFIPFKYSIEDIKEYRKGLKVLKDSDILDRTRLNDNVIIDENEINFIITGQIYDFAVIINKEDDMYEYNKRIIK